jgi:hypothetical protein
VSLTLLLYAGQLAACELCDDVGVPHKVYVSAPCDIRLVDNLQILVTPLSIIITDGITADEKGLFYLTTNVDKVIRRTPFPPVGWELCSTCGNMYMKEAIHE